MVREVFALDLTHLIDSRIIFLDSSHYLRLMKETISILLLLLILALVADASLVASTADNSTSNITSSRIQLADLWTDRGGTGLNVSCGYYKVGERAVIHFKLYQAMYVELYIIRPDGTRIKIMNSTFLGPGIDYRTSPILFIDPGTRTVQLLGARSHALLDSCKLFVGEKVVGGDIWTERGGKGRDNPGGTFPPLSPIKVAFMVNTTADVELKAVTSKGERSIYEGVAEAGKVRYVYVEALREGTLTLKLIYDNRTLDSCKILILVPTEEYPPSLRISRINVSGLTVEISGEVKPGTPNATVRLIWKWGDGSEEEGPFPKRHVYRKEGNYTIRLIAKQSDGLSSNFTYRVHVSRPSETTSSKGPEVETPEVTTSYVTKVVTVTPRAEKEASPPYQLIAFALGGITAIVLSILLSKLLEGKEEENRGIESKSAGDDRPSSQGSSP